MARPAAPPRGWWMTPARPSCTSIWTRSSCRLSCFRDPSCGASPGGGGGRRGGPAESCGARRYGVNSAMPMTTALQRCPQVIVLSGNYREYSRYSHRVMSILEAHTPLVEQLSIDEAFLDVSGARRVHGSPFQIAQKIRERVHQETGLSCSIGVAATKYVAKVASTLSKPNGLLVVPGSETADFLRPLPVSHLWGVGRVTGETLSKLGLRTVGDVREVPPDALVRALGVALAERLIRLAHGIDPREVETGRVEKSISHERTFEHDEHDPVELRRAVLGLADAVAVRLREHGVLARTVALKIRYNDFRTLTRSRTLAEPADVGRRLYDEATGVLAGLIGSGERVRLLGVRAEQLQPAGTGAPLWDPDEEWRDTERTVDSIAAKFGRGALRPAALLRSGDRVRGPGGWE